MVRSRPPGGEFSESSPGLSDGLDGGNPVLHVVVAVAVVLFRRHDGDLRVFGGFPEGGYLLHDVDDQVGQFLYGCVVARVADIEDFSVAGLFVRENGQKGVDAVGDVGEAPVLLAAVDEGDGAAGQNVEDHLGDGPGGPLLGVPEGVEPGADPVEGAEEGVPETPFLAVGGDDPVHHLLAAAVDPAHLADGSHDEGAFVFLEDGVGAHAVDFGGGGEDDPLFRVGAHADDLQVLFEVELEGPEGLLR